MTIEPGAGRLVSLLAFQELPRRLALDFKDAVSEGMEFESITGTIAIADGQAHTDVVRLTGPIGVVDVTGSADFVNETFDQHIIILPNLTSSLPLFGLLSGGVTTGLSVLLTDNLLKGLGINFDEIGKREYHLSGDWDEPDFTEVKIQRTPVNTYNVR